MVQFGILNCLIFLPWSFLVILVADTPVMVVPYVIAFVAKTLSRS
jgi:hypothetical protein